MPAAINLTLQTYLRIELKHRQYLTINLNSFQIQLCINVEIYHYVRNRIS